MYERFTDGARKVLALANQEAQRFNHEYIAPEHVLLGLVKEGYGVGANVLKILEVDTHKVRLEVEKLVRSGPETVQMGKLPLTPETQKVLDGAIAQAKRWGHNYVGTEHVLYALADRVDADNTVGQVLRGLNVLPKTLETTIMDLLGIKDGDPPRESTAPSQRQSYLSAREVARRVHATKTLCNALIKFNPEKTELSDLTRTEFRDVEHPSKEHFAILDIGKGPTIGGIHVYGSQFAYVFQIPNKPN